MDEGIKLNTSPLERKEGESLPERIHAAFDQMETEAGRERLASRAVFAGKVLEPEYIELALRHAEKHVLEPNIDDAVGQVRDKFAPFHLAEEREQEIARNIAKYREAYRSAPEELGQYNKEKTEHDKVMLTEAQENGYTNDFASALRAEEEGKFELAYLIYINSPWNEGDEKMKEIFLHRAYWAAASTGVRSRLLAVWSGEHDHHHLIEVIKKRLDERARIWDKLSPQTRLHVENMIPEYEVIGDWQEVARRAEQTPASLFVEVEDAPTGFPPELVSRFVELVNLSTQELKPLNKEELARRMQTQQG